MLISNLHSLLVLVVVVLLHVNSNEYQINISYENEKQNLLRLMIENKILILGANLSNVLL